MVVYQPRTPDVRRAGRASPPPCRRGSLSPPLAPVQVRTQFAAQPRIESLAVRRGELLCTNDDIIRNSASNWSPMSAAEIAAKTGIESRCYTEGGLEHLALDAAVSALDRAGRSPEEMGAVLFCTCTHTRLLPSAATWLSGQLGMFQTHTSVDLVAACAGFPYGLVDAVRILQEVRRPVLLVCAEKFSDKVGSVRTSRMIFGDGAAALVVAPAPDGVASDVDVLQTYASGPESQVNSIIWPNVEFGCDITVYGPEVKALVKRYLEQMIEELQTLPHPDGEAGTLVDAIDLIIPHQANKRMVIDLAEQAGIGRDRMYFNIARVGNTSAASIPLAIHDAVREGVLSGPDPRVHARLRSGGGRRIRGAAYRPGRRRAGANRACDDDGRRPAAGAAPHGVVRRCRGSLWRLTHGRDRSGFTARRPPTRNAAPTRLRRWGGDVTLLPEGVPRLRPQPYPGITGESWTASTRNGRCRPRSLRRRPAPRPRRPPWLTLLTSLLPAAGAQPSGRDSPEARRPSSPDGRAAGRRREAGSAYGADPSRISASRITTASLRLPNAIIPTMSNSGGTSFSSRCSVLARIVANRM